MKTNKLARISALCAGALLLQACAKKEEPVAPAATPATEPAAAAPTTGELQDAASAARQEMTNQAAAAKAAAEEAVTNAQQQVQTTTAQDQAQVQSRLDEIRTLIAEKKYTEALALVSQLSGLQLTPEQQQTLQDLRAQIQQAVSQQGTSDALKAAGGLLDRKN